MIACFNGTVTFTDNVKLESTLCTVLVNMVTRSVRTKADLTLLATDGFKGLTNKANGQKGSSG